MKKIPAILPKALFALALAAALALPVAGSAGRNALGCTIKGTLQPDRLYGTPRADVICGLAAGDEIHARGGNDIVIAGTGDDAIYGDAGRDRLYGGAGADTFLARDGRRDVVVGGSGRDRGLLDVDRARSVEERFPSRRGRNAVVVAAGDIAKCGVRGDDFTAVLLDLFPTATVATLGDSAYDSASLSEFKRCYGPTWGRAKARTRPSIGDHEFRTPGAAGYFDYFGARAGDRQRAYYSYNLGSWHVVVLNTHCSTIGGCSDASAEAQWLRADLAAHPARCTLAYGHRPRFSSNNSKLSPAIQPLWQALYDAGAEIVLAGDSHTYERFAPMTPAGAPDPARGIREFVVGTGGRSHGTLDGVYPGSQVRNNDTFGVLTLNLRPGSYSWRFVPIAGGRFVDRGSGICH